MGTGVIPPARRQQLEQQAIAEALRRQSASDKAHGKVLTPEPAGGPQMQSPYGGVRTGPTTKLHQPLNPNTYSINPGSTGGRNYSPNPFNERLQEPDRMQVPTPVQPGPSAMGMAPPQQSLGMPPPQQPPQGGMPPQNQMMMRPPGQQMPSAPSRQMMMAQALRAR